MRRWWRNPQFNRLGIFYLQLVYLAVLAILAWSYNIGRLWEPLGAIPDPIGPMPLAVPWFGALGGTLISLSGVHKHRYTWDVRFWSWHAARPVVGAAVAIVAVMIIQVGILGTGLTLEAGKANTFYYLVAWIAGYREETFRSMVSRLADVVLTSREEGLPPRVVAVDPSTGKEGSTVTIKGAGFTGTESVTFGTNLSPTIRVVSDTAIEVEVPAQAGSEAATTVGVLTPKGAASAVGAFTYET
jgi:hypothetical protein